MRHVYSEIDLKRVLLMGCLARYLSCATLVFQGYINEDIHAVAQQIEDQMQYENLQNVRVGLCTNNNWYSILIISGCR